MELVCERAVWEIKFSLLAAAPGDQAFLFFIAPESTGDFALSLHDALPICRPGRHVASRRRPDRPARRRRAGRSPRPTAGEVTAQDRKSTRLNSSHDQNSYAVVCVKKKKTQRHVKPAGATEIIGEKHDP